MAQTIKQEILNLSGLTCPACEQKIEKAIKKLEGVKKVSVSYTTCKADISYDFDLVTIERIKEAVIKAGYDVVDKERDLKNTDKTSASSTFYIILILIGLYIIVQNTVGFNFFPQITANMGYGMLFVAGLFTSVHCIAMCGGINLSQCAGCQGCDNNSTLDKLKPSFLYNLGRVTSYTILGGIVGALGSIFQVSLHAKAFITVFAGVFMIIMGVNMLGVFPSLRRLMPRLPKRFTLSIEQNKQGKMPFVVGILNGFMPCGPLQAMQLYALGTGSLFAGAFSMFLFSLGTVPLMFVFGAISTMLSAGFTKQMMKISAALVIVLGIVMGNRGFSLAGINMTGLILTPLHLNHNSNDGAKAVMKEDYQTITTNLESGRYESFTVHANVPLKWTILAKEGTLNGCNNEIIISDYKIDKKLKLGENVIEFTPMKTGTITYSCWMGMISANIIVEE